MSLDLASIIGLIGSGLMVIAYAYSNMAKVLNFTLFNLLNLIGALLLIYSLTVHFNVASMALEIVWALIALIGLAKALQKGKAS
ncbi:CBU_0592 family membrane protein [Sphingobium bisphenolivorans]|uniref:CBU_0592 family membrane protein n=1 Tax=Sphingobium bisphenolivorans TaxID=1335760 RepID=UPI0003A315CF|nr:hypothetical protein [Sphingobium bisphenolivorans]